jgi:single-stranded-DNA-specific exonuclease
VKKREYEKEVSGHCEARSNPGADEQSMDCRVDFSQEQKNLLAMTEQKSNLVASCRSPEWCNLVELLDECREYFVRYGGHRQAAGFTIEEAKLADFQKTIREKFLEKYGTGDLPKKTLSVECRIDPKDMKEESLDMIDRFRPFGIGNRKPLFLLEDVTIIEAKPLGKEGKHLALRCQENSEVKMILWNA